MPTASHKCQRPLTLSSDLSTIIKQIADHLRIDPASLQIRPIRHGRLERNNVWRFNTPAKDYVLKQHLVAQPIGKSAFTSFQIETAVLPILHRAGCRVPQIVWKSEFDSTLLLKECGEKTLDDLPPKTSSRLRGTRFGNSAAWNWRLPTVQRPSNPTSIR